MRRSLENLFVRYRERGDLAALGTLFDRTAGDLFVLAQHLVRDFDDAEDLVQATFVTAIDRADTYEATRPLQPWLSGILARHASNRVRERSRHRRSDGPARVVDDAEPADSLERAELQASVRAAIARLEPRYARVLAPYLEQGETPAEIARRLELAPGTVRAQICRGLVQLRRLLPAGAAAVVPSFDLVGVRREVLGHAMQSAVAASGTTTLFTLGAIIMMKKTLIAGAVALAALLWMRSLPSDGHEEEGARAAASPSLDTDDGGGGTGQEMSRATTESERTAAGPRLDADVEARAGRLTLVVALPDIAPEHVDGVRFRVQVDGAGTGESEETQEMILREKRAMEGLLARRSRAMSRTKHEDALASLERALERSRRVSVRFDRRPRATGGARSSHRRNAAVELDITAASSDFNGAATELWITASHDLYFEGEASVTCYFNSLESLRRGEDVTLDAEVSCVPAAVVTGRLELPESRKADERQRALRALESELVAARDAMDPDPRRYSEKVALVESRLDAMSAQLDRRPMVGLLRTDAEVPLARVGVEADGSFRIKVAEEGHFRLVAVAHDQPVAQRDVWLRVAHETELESPVEFSRNATLEFVVEDFGASESGGRVREMGQLEITRVSSTPVTNIEWRSDALAWIEGRVVRRRVLVNDGDDGIVRVTELSPGPHSIGLPEGAACAFGEDRRASFSTEVTVPSSGVIVALPLAILDVRVERPADVPGTGRTQLVVPGRTEGAAPILVAEDVGASQLVFAEPDRPIRLELRDPNLVFDPWTGSAPKRGRSRTVEFSGLPPD